MKINVETRATASLIGLSTNGPVYALKRPGNPYYTHEVYIGGEFTVAGGAPISNCAMYHHEDQTWDSLGDGLNGPVYAIEQKGVSLWLAPNFAMSPPAKTGDSCPADKSIVLEKLFQRPPERRIVQFTIICVGTCANNEYIKV